MGASQSHSPERKRLLDEKDSYRGYGRVQAKDSVSEGSTDDSSSRSSNENNEEENVGGLQTHKVSFLVSLRKERLWAVAACALIACLGSLLNGLMLGYSSATLLELDNIFQEGDHVYGIKQSSMYYSLFGAFGALGGLFGAPIASPLSDRLGRKPALMLGGLPAAFGWLLISLAHTLPTRGSFLAILLLGRILTGVSAGWFVFCVSVYIVEISSAGTKGLFGACNQLLIAIGLFMAYGIGTFSESESEKYSAFSYYHVALIALGVVALFVVLMTICTVETPRWLYAHGQIVKAQKNLVFLRGYNADISEEIRSIENEVQKGRKTSFLRTFNHFKHRSVYQPFILVFLLMFFQQFSGINAAVFYAGSIFEQANVSDASLVSALAVGGVQIIFTFFSIILVEFLGRKLLLLISSIGMCLSSLLLGVHFFITDHVCNGCTGSDCMHPSNHTVCEYNLGPLAITSVFLFNAAFSLAWGPLPWLMMSELLPQRVRSLAGSIETFFNWTFATIITVAFKEYQKAVTPEGAWWSFAFIMFLSIFFVVLFLPETKGYKLEEIGKKYFKEGSSIFALSFYGKPHVSIVIRP